MMGLDGVEIQVQEFQINGNYGENNCSAMDTDVLKSVWKMRILLYWLVENM